MSEIKEKFYEKLNPQERVRLAISALTRCDYEEGRRLTRSCQKFTYSMVDREYVDRINAISWVKMHFSYTCVYYYGKAELFEVLLITKKLLTEFAPPEYTSHKPSISDLESALTDQLSKLKSLFQGFDQFCESKGLNSKNLIEWFEVENACAKIYEYISRANIECSSEYTETFKNDFEAIWMEAAP